MNAVNSTISDSFTNVRNFSPVLCCWDGNGGYMSGDVEEIQLFELGIYKAEMEMWELEDAEHNWKKIR